MNIKTMLMGFEDDIRDKLAVMFYNTEIEIRGDIHDVTRAIDIIDREKPDMLLIHALADRKTLTFCQQIYILYPKTIMVMISDSPGIELFQSAMEAGIRKVIAPIPAVEVLTSILKELYISENSRYVNFSDDTTRAKKTEIVFVFGAKGGIGKTTLAVNIAVKLASTKKKVVFLDFNLQYGDSNLLLGLDNKNTVAELLLEQNNPTLDIVNEYLVFHQSGLKVMFAPKSPEYAETISGKNIEKIINILRNYYDYIIIDGTVGFSEANLGILDLCSMILFLTEEDILVLKNSKKALLLLQSLNMGGKVRLLLNKNRLGSISLAEVEHILGYKVEALIEYDSKNVRTALNQGRPVVLNAPNCNFSKSVYSVIDIIDRSIPKMEVKARPKALPLPFSKKKQEKPKKSLFNVKKRK